MRIHFNQTVSGKIYKNINQGVPFTKTTPNLTSEFSERKETPNINQAYFPNISFRKRNADAEFLLRQAKRLKCAYSGKFMLSQAEIKDIFSKLERRVNAQSAINLLQIYEHYMHDTELAVFELLKQAPHKGKRDFKDILLELQPEALIRLREKQISILRSTDNIIEKMSPPIAELVRLIRDNALAKVEDNTFGRQPPLEMIKSVKATGPDLNRIKRIYQVWYKLPNSAIDVDAFIVKYSRKSHDDIAKRLICSAEATVEHIVPSSRKKRDSLSNMILVSKRFNNERKSMPLDEYMMLNQEIDMRKHLQKYIDLVIKEVNRKKSEFAEISWYPEQIKKAISIETSRKINLDIDALVLTKAQKKEINAPLKLLQKYEIPS